ncbi:UDP-glucose 4-epimerase GalE [Halomonas sp.]|uniref:UDP-glucose 4-epimerase GalE n=1 Tax=Halomonas sp. TaxID=1486246 RepID=UPI00384F3654
MKILVTGGAGYIGSHLVRLASMGKASVVVLDSLVTGHRKAVEGVELVELDLTDSDGVAALLKSHNFDAVIHFAASSIVSDSVTSPFRYYSSNTCNTLSLINLCARAGVGYFVFSSTAAVYGEPLQEHLPIKENCPQTPINPYGRSKLASEWALQDISAVSGMKYGILRYFNVCGADRKEFLGESHNPETHLIPLLAKTALGIRQSFSLYGQDYPTPDGTCIRDYVDVEDLAQSHVDVLDYLMAGNPSDTFNCGYGHGYSVREVIDAMQSASGCEIPLELASRRVGDPPSLVADSSKLRQLTGWQPKNNNLVDICRSVLNWEQNPRY